MRRVPDCSCFVWIYLIWPGYYPVTYDAEERKLRYVEYIVIKISGCKTCSQPSQARILGAVEKWVSRYSTIRHWLKLHQQNDVCNHQSEHLKISIIFAMQNTTIKIRRNLSFPPIELSHTFLSLSKLNQIKKYNQYRCAYNHLEFNYFCFRLYNIIIASAAWRKWGKSNICILSQYGPLCKMNKCKTVLAWVMIVWWCRSVHFMSAQSRDPVQ